MAFFHENLDEQAYRWAKSLFDAVKNNNRFVGKTNPCKLWSKEFVNLRKRFSPEIIDRVLTWYIAHFNDEFMFRAWSGASFRVKFEQIMARMASEEDVVQEVTEETQSMVMDLLDNYNFPVEIATALPVIAQRTDEAWEKFAQKMLIHSEKFRDEQFLTHVYNLYAPTFVFDWCVLLASKYGSMRNYTGSTTRLIWKPDHVLFRDHMWHEWSREWCGSAVTFDPLLEELKK